jgi:tetratricopeptide (TPR) repeat protein
MELVLRLAGYGYSTSFLVKVDWTQAYTPNDHFTWQFYLRETPGKSHPFLLPIQKQPGSVRIFILGESAALGTPNPAFGFGRILEVMLRAQFPQRRFEVINAAMRGINSHIILPIALECARHKPDMFLVYTGNNEVIGLHAPGPDSGLFDRHLILIRAAQRVKSTKLAQLLAITLLKARHRPSPEQDMDFFRQHRVALDDPCRQAVYRNFQANLQDLCRIVTRAKAKLILSTVPVNLQDFPPLASLPRADLANTDRTRWERARQQGADTEAKGDYSLAVEHYVQAAQIDDHFAELHFRLARCYLTLKRFEKARDHFGLARDWDAIPVRADSAINEVIRAVAAGNRTGGVELVDAERVFAESDQVERQTPRDRLFLDHVHLRFEGDYLLARTFYTAIVDALADVLGQPAHPSSQPLSGAACAERLAFTEWDRLQIDLDMHRNMNKPPFLDQLEHGQRQAQAELELKHRVARFQKSDLDRSIAIYRKAMAQSPDDWELSHNLGMLYFQIKDYSAAAQYLEAEVKEFPNLPSCRIYLSLALARAGRTQEAIRHLREALRIEPNFGPAKAGLAALESN